MSVVKLKPGETVLVTAAGADLKPDHTLPTPPDQAQDPWYGIDLGLGYLRPGGGPMPGGGDRPIDPGYGVDEDTGWCRPDHSLPVPPPPVDPAWGIDEILGFLRPDNSLPVPPDPKPPGAKWEIKTAWTPVSGWIVVAVPTEEALVPTPSKSKR